MGTFEVTESGLLVSFSFKIDDIFADAARISAIRTKNVVDEKGVNAFSARLSEDERPMFENILPDICDNIWTRLEVYAKRNNGDYRYNVELFDLAEAPLGFFVVYDVNMGLNYDSKNVAILDRIISRAITSGVLGEYFDKIGQGLLSQTYHLEYNSHLSLLHSLLLKRIAAIKRSTSFFS